MYSLTPREAINRELLEVLKAYPQKPEDGLNLGNLREYFARFGAWQKRRLDAIARAEGRPPQTDMITTQSVIDAIRDAADDVIASAERARTATEGYMTANGWQPIESYHRQHPAYDEIILLAWDDRVVPGRWVSNAGYKGFQPLSLIPRPWNESPQPSHWMPLPALPVRAREATPVGEANPTPTPQGEE